MNRRRLEWTDGCKNNLFYGFPFKHNFIGEATRSDIMLRSQSLSRCSPCWVLSGFRLFGWKFREKRHGTRNSGRPTYQPKQSHRHWSFHSRGICFNKKNVGCIKNVKISPIMPLASPSKLFPLTSMPFCNIPTSISYQTLSYPLPPPNPNTISPTDPHVGCKGQRH